MSGRAQTTALVLAAGRVGFGVALFVSPNLAARWAGKDARTPGARLIIRALAARDAALGLGTLTSAREAAQLRPWLIAASACDAADFAATLAGPRSPGRSLVLGMAAMATVAGLGTAAAV
jgi:hypothetical protein